MPLAPGTRLGPYEILAPIGAGGMGVVYKGRDTRLDRIVAIKVSKSAFSERFEREAHAIAKGSWNWGAGYDILPDGKRFVMVRGADPEGAREIVLVQNWFEELKRLASPAK